jgi:hypothetical protein
VLTKMKSSRSRGHGPKETTACSVIRRAISDGNLASSVTKNRLPMVCRRRKLQSQRNGDRMRLITRNGYDWTKSYPWIV